MNERTALEGISVHGLRKLAGERGIGSGTWRAGARKEDLIKALLGEDVSTETSTPDAVATLQSFASILEGLMSRPSIDQDAIEEMVKAAIERNAVPSHRIEIKVNDAPVMDIERQHALFEHLLITASARVHAYLTGPAGSGKTTAAETVASTLGLSFSCQSFGPQTPQSVLLGYMQAEGKYISTEFRKRFEEGGVFVFDEMDNASPHVVTVLNSALANGYCAFPDQMIQRHPDFIVVACANTFGQGGDRQYLRNQLDAATLDRFAFIEWAYDEEFEASLVGATFHAPGRFIKPKQGGTLTNQEWFDRVLAIRKAVASLQLRIVISPRATILGTRLFAAGMGQHWVEEMLIWKGIDDPTRAKIKSNLAA